MRRQAPDLRDERGTTLPELLVATMSGAVVLLILAQMVTVSLHSSARIEGRVNATQRARVVLYQIMDELHSSCVAPQTIPVRAGSTGTSITFVHARGSAVTPVPVLRQITLNGSTLQEAVFAATGGVAPNWTFSSTATSSRDLMTDASQTTGVPLFRYYAYSNGAISTTPLPTPLSTTDAARTVQVDVSFDADPLRTEVTDANGDATVQSTALLRFSPPGYDASAPNAPCQ